MMMKRPLRVLLHAEPEALEVFLGFTLFVFGMWQLLLGDANPSSNPTSHGYDLASMVFGSLRGIGLAAVGLGILQMVGALFMLPHALRAFADFACALFYCLISASLISWVWRATSVPVYASLAMAHGWVAWREWRRRHGF